MSRKLEPQVLILASLGRVAACPVSPHIRLALPGTSSIVRMHETNLVDLTLQSTMPANYKPGFDKAKALEQTIPVTTGKDPFDMWNDPRFENSSIRHYSYALCNPHLLGLGCRLDDKQAKEGRCEESVHYVDNMLRLSEYPLRRGATTKTANVAAARVN